MVRPARPVIACAMIRLVSMSAYYQGQNIPTAFTIDATIPRTPNPKVPEGPRKVRERSAKVRERSATVRSDLSDLSHLSHLSDFSYLSDLSDLSSLSDFSDFSDLSDLTNTDTPLQT